MEQEKFDIWVMEYLSDVLGEDARKEFESFLRDNPEHLENFERLNGTWNDLESLSTPEPSKKMDESFFDMLHIEIDKTENEKKDAGSWVSKIVEVLWKPQMAYGILLLVMGFSLGYFLKTDAVKASVATSIVRNSDTENVREQLVLTLLEQPSASKRLKGISEVNKIQKLDDRVISALLQTLNNDTNVNVRLTAIESLSNYLDNPTVREGMVQSIVKQDAPIVQVTLANLMVALQEKKAIEPFRTLMRTKELDTSVKQKLETTIKSII